MDKYHVEIQIKIHTLNIKATMQLTQNQPTKKSEFFPFAADAL